MTKKMYKYEGLNNEQIDIINRFTKFRAAKEAEKQMAHIMGENATDWRYSGYVDTGFFGGGKCSLGHTLRYKHFATNKKTKEVVVFGIKCVSDFFQITPDKLKMIQENFVQINKQVDEIIQKFRDGYDVQGIKNKYKSLANTIEHSTEIEALLSVDLPLPYWYEKIVEKAYYKETSKRTFNEFLDQHPEYLGPISVAQLYVNNSIFKGKHPEVSDKIDSLMKKLETKESLTEPQLRLLNKLVMMPYDEIDKIVDDLKLLQPNDFFHRPGWDDYKVFQDLMGSYKEYGLTDKQMKLLEKVRTRCDKKIQAIKNNEYNTMVAQEG